MYCSRWLRMAIVIVGKVTETLCLLRRSFCMNPKQCIGAPGMARPAPITPVSAGFRGWLSNRRWCDGAHKNPACTTKCG